MKNLSIKLIVCLVLATMTNQVQAIDRARLIQYASSLKGKKKAELKKAIYNCSQPKQVLTYGSGEGRTWSGFYQTDRISGTQECVNRYSDRRFYFSSTNSVISGMNIEHSFPKSWWGGTNNNAYKDLFNLYPSETDANSKKSNYPMGKVTNPNILNDYEKVGSGPAGSLGNIRLCEPNDKWKGDFCRSYFYMATVYQNLHWEGTEGLHQLENNEWPTLKEWAYKLYLEWTRKDQVLDIEIQRNNAIYSIQGNRNLFIDFPFLAEYVWGDSIDVAFDPYTALTTASDDHRYVPNSIIPGGGNNQDEDEPTGGGDEPTGGDDDDQPIMDETGGDYYFAERFDFCDGKGGNDGLWNGSIAAAAITSYDDWKMTAAYKANGCVKAGAGSKKGIVTTPAISGLKGTSFTLYFNAGAWDKDGENTSITVSASNCTLSNQTFVLTRGEWNTYSITVTNVTGDVQFTFSSVSDSGNRFFLDNILIPYEEIFDQKKNYTTYDLNADGRISIKDLTELIYRINKSQSSDTPDADKTDYRLNDLVYVVDLILEKEKMDE